MVGVYLLLQLTLCVTSIDAFYPWIPDDHHCEGRACLTSRRAGPVQGVTFEVAQRASDSDEDPTARTARAVQEAKRLASKYSGVPLAHSPGHPGLIGRSNEYSVMEPTSPSAPNSAGIYQDGGDYSYFMKAFYGSSKKAMYMLLDSGAGTTWVMGPECQTRACKMHNNFGAADSKTLAKVPETFDIAYGSGAVKGDIYKDTISVAGMELDMTFGIATETSDDFVHFPFDGILGLAMGKGRTDNFMKLVTKSKLISANMFSVSLHRGSDGPNTGQVTFGAIDKSQYVGDITYTAVSDGGNDWSIPLDGLGYKGKVAQNPVRQAYIDTGTSFAFGPADDVALLHSLIPGSYLGSDNITYTVPCSHKEPLTITFSGVTYDISHKDWRVGSGDKCRSNIYGMEVVQDAWLIGDTFLKNVYTVFDADHKRVGFAKKPKYVAPSTTSASPTASGAGASPTGGASDSGKDGDKGGSSNPAGTVTDPDSKGDKDSLAGKVERNMVAAVLALVGAIVMAC